MLAQILGVKMKTILIAMVTLTLTACSAFQSYPNSREPVDFTGKESWALVSLVQKPDGFVLINGVRDDANVQSQMDAGKNSHYRRETLLDPAGSNTIYVRDHIGRDIQEIRLTDIVITPNTDYVLEYTVSRDDGKIAIALFEKETEHPVVFTRHTH
ncbi:MAG: hypothetical protein ACI9QV_001124 [Methylophagaceae bacterium]|jgi:hypothetical protein